MADLLRGDYKPADYGKVILLFTVLRRLDCVLEPTKAAVLAELELRTKAEVPRSDRLQLLPQPPLPQVSGCGGERLAGSAPGGTPARGLLPRGLHHGRRGQ